MKREKTFALFIYVQKKNIALKPLEWVNFNLQYSKVRQQREIHKLISFPILLLFIVNVAAHLYINDMYTPSKTSFNTNIYAPLKHYVLW